MEKERKVFKCKKCNAYLLYPMCTCYYCRSENEISDFKQAYIDTCEVFESYIQNSREKIAQHYIRYCICAEKNKVIRNINIALSILCSVLAFILILLF